MSKFFVKEYETNYNRDYNKSKNIISNNTLKYRRSNWNNDIIRFKHRQPNKKEFNDFGWSYMPPASWSVPQERPPSCIPQKECPVCPTMDDKYASALKWDSVGSIMPKFRYKEIYNPDYYMPGWTAKSQVRYRPKYYGDTKPVFKNINNWKGKYVT